MLFTNLWVIPFHFGRRLMIRQTVMTINGAVTDMTSNKTHTQNNNCCNIE
jgi:hypothetical protein